MDHLLSTLMGIRDFVCGPFLLQPLLLGIGAFIMIGLGFMPIRRFTTALHCLVTSTKRDTAAQGEISPFKALMTSMAASIGSGNIFGVASAMLVGGPGAIFWMWATALVGMATKFSETTLAVHYREVTPQGNFVGGPMYYIKNGLGRQWAWLGSLFAIFGALACLGTGNLTQSNTIAKTLESSFYIPNYVTAVTLFIVAGSVLLGGVKRIGAVAAMLVPFMAIAYIIFGLAVMIIHIERLPEALSLIFTHAFSTYAVGGGATGIAVTKAIQMGVARGLFSNEAGLGTAPIAHAAAITNSPVRQGFLAMIDPVVDTLVVCTVTAMIILLSGQYGAEGAQDPASLTALVFANVVPGPWGAYMVSLLLILFCFTTILGWSVYGERCAMYLFGDKVMKPYRILLTLLIPVGAMTEISIVWPLADLLNGLMAMPNLIAIVILSPVVFRLTKEYFSKLDAQKGYKKNKKKAWQQ